MAISPIPFELGFVCNWWIPNGKDIVSMFPLKKQILGQV
jgi:hypothetical protein